MKKNYKTYLFLIAFGVAMLLLAKFGYFRIDLTADKRFSLSQQTKSLMLEVDEPIHAKLYLNGDLNPGFTRLRQATIELLNELNALGTTDLIIEHINPSAAKSTTDREAVFESLIEKSLIPSNVFDKDKEGKLMQKTIFPYLEIFYKNRTTAVNLLKNIPNLSGEENLNISIENLEFEIASAIKRLTKRKVEKIAFIEGQGELDELQTYEISTHLSQYFQIDRGVIENDASVLDDYKVVIIAGSSHPFSENTKFIIDQYLMRGGKALWLIDGVRVSEEYLQEHGRSPIVKLDLNLDDLLFKYGVRISPAIIEDQHCVVVPMRIGDDSTIDKLHPMPFYFSPLLLTSMNHPISKNLSFVKSSFTSPIELVNKSEHRAVSVLLASSDKAHLLQVPNEVDLRSLNLEKPSDYFDQKHVAVAVSIEGIFESLYTNQIAPKGIVNHHKIEKESVPTRQVFIANSDLIRNDVRIENDEYLSLPLGYDRFSDVSYGNIDFLVNAILYLADEDGSIDLRAKTLPLRLLNKSLVAEQKVKLQVINILLPMLLLAVFATLYFYIRKRKYTKKL